MKGTEKFAEAIKAHLDNLAQTDELFAKEYAKENKSIEECVQFILSEVQKSGCNGFADEEIFGLALHYFSEDNLEITNVGTHHVELTEEEIAEAKEKARQQLMREEMERQRKPKATPKPKAEEAKQPELSLFDF